MRDIGGKPPQCGQLQALRSLLGLRKIFKDQHHTVVCSAQRNTAHPDACIRCYKRRITSRLMLATALQFVEQQRGKILHADTFRDKGCRRVGLGGVAQ